MITVDRADDLGIAVKYVTFDKDEYVLLRSVLTDGIVEQAREVANKTGKFKNSTFIAELFRLMTLDYNIKTQDGSAWVLNEKNLADVPSAFRQWWSNEIDKQDGSVAPLATVTIKGVEIPFREAA